MSQVTLTTSRTTARAFVRSVADALESLPGGFDRLLGSRGVDVYVAGRWSDIWEDWDPRESTLDHRGGSYEHWGQVGAYYSVSGRRVMMVEEIWEDGGWRTDRGHALPTLGHELGHALDHTSSPRPSQHPEFRRIYLEEREQAKAVAELDYYTWHWSPGAIEVFATAVQACVADVFREDDPSFMASFSGCIDWVGSYLERTTDRLETAA